MAKKKTGSIVFKCTNCSHTQPRWLGRCPECGEWNSFTEESVDLNAVTQTFGGVGSSIKQKPIPLSKIDPLEGKRFLTGIGEFDRVLGGGAMKPSCILLGGEPGIGKSTLMLQAAEAMSGQNGRVLYVSGEESAAQIRVRADRLQLQCENIEILCTSRLDDIEDALKALKPICVFVDSIQTVYTVEAGNIPGSVNQLKYCSSALSTWAKENDSVLFMSAHVTKDGQIAGPKVLEHLVDAVISFEQNNDRIRFLRALKNRFGSVDELGIFTMTEKGLIPVDDPSNLFIISREGELPAGVAVVPVFEGSRVFLVEIQALTVPAKSTVTRVYSDKIDSARVSRVAAVLEKRTGLQFSDQDLYINVAGGVRLTESAIDAGLCAALYSARTDIPLKAKTAITGELSLAGEIRPVNRLKQRIKASKSMRFEQFFAPEIEQDAIEVLTIKDLLKAITNK